MFLLWVWAERRQDVPLVALKGEAMTEIGNPVRQVEAYPVEDPVPAREPKEAPVEAPSEDPVEVPA